MNRFTVTKSQVSMRLDAFCSLHSLLSRTKINQMIQNQQIHVNDKPTKPKTKLKLGDVVLIPEFIPSETHIEPIEMPLEIVYEDADYVIVNKPKGMIVHPGKNTFKPTLLNGLVYYFKTIGLNHTPGLVHRIDKETQGLLVIAKNSIVHNFLAEQLLDKRLHRTYIAVVHGEVPFDTTSVDVPIGKHPSDKTKMSIQGLDAKHALTHFKVVQRLDKATVLECTLESGRTHQIRVHVAYIGHPLVGDQVYGMNPTDTGQALCAYKLAFIHPKTLKEVEYTCSYDATIQYACGLLK